MQLSDLTSNAQYVALAGLATVVVAGWRQVQGFLRYIAGFLVVTASLDSSLGFPLTRYFRKNWYLLPSGQFWIMTTRAMHQSWKMRVTVPFKIPNKTSVYLRWPHAVVFTGGANGGLKITTLRWTNVKTIIREALEQDVEYDRQANLSSITSRYHVYEIMGQDKSLVGFQGQTRPRGDDSEPTSASEGKISGSGSSDDPWIFPDLDKSFMYDYADYTEPAKSYDDGVCFLPDDAMMLLEETQKWFQQREWFQHRVIPWRRGMLLYGPGGTGKSTFANIMAKRLKVPLYRFHLNTLSDMEFMERMDNLQSPCVVLFEDFDQVFNKRQSVKNQYLSFDTVINMLSGVKTLEGVVTVITTNHLEAIDPAIGVDVGESGMSSRPGRIDRVLYMGSLPAAQRHLMIERILSDWPDLIEKAKSETDNFTIVQTQEYCVQQALLRIH